MQHASCATVFADADVRMPQDSHDHDGSGVEADRRLLRWVVVLVVVQLLVWVHVCRRRFLPLRWRIRPRVWQTIPSRQSALLAFWRGREQSRL